MSADAICITGSGIICAIGNHKAEVLQALRQKRSGIAPVAYLDTLHRELPVGEVKRSNAQLLEQLSLPPHTEVGRTALLGAVAAREALHDAGLDADSLQHAMFLSGTTVGGMDNTERYYLDMQQNDAHLAALASHASGVTSRISATLAGLDARRVVTVSTACSSAANALIMGANLIRTGRADVVVAGGAESLSKFHLSGFNTLMILDRQPCRPFDDTRAGLNLGEGAAYVVLERLSDAERRGAVPQAVLSGYGNACDAHHQTASSPDGEGAYRAMRQALQMAALTPADIDYVNAHGTGTPNNDASESAALFRLFGSHCPPVSSTKSFTGHTTSASGAIEAVICMLALQHGLIPANLGWLHPMTDGIRPSLGAYGCTLRHVMCNSFGFGGNDSSLVLSTVGQGTRLSRPRPLPKVYVRGLSVIAAGEPVEGLREFASPLESRRMPALLRSALVSSMRALQQAGVSCPDAIVTATTLGMLATSEKFLLQMCREGEDMLGPTLFMQSTHNTIAGMLGIKTGSHGYNTTLTQAEPSVRMALTDALMQLQLTEVRHVLVGAHDETTPLFSSLVNRLYGTDVPVGQSSVAVVLGLDAEGALAELDLEALTEQIDRYNVLHDLPVYPIKPGAHA